MNTWMLLEMTSGAFPDRVAVVCDGERLTYGQLGEAAVRAAAARAEGTERLALLDTSSPAFPVALFAAGRAGVPFVPLNYRLTDAEIERLAERVTPLELVTDANRAAALGSLPGVTTVERKVFLERPEGSPADAPMDPDSIAVLLFTSGTTGEPKAAVLRHKHLVSYVLSSVEFGSAGEDEATLMSVPPYHVAGVAAVLSSVYAGRRIVQLPNFSPEAWLRLVEEEGITNAFVVPTMLGRILDTLDQSGAATPASLRAIAYGGGKMPGPVIERALKRFPDVAFTQAYGLTETSSTLAVLGPAEHRAALESDDPAARKRLGSVGLPIPGMDVEVRDEDGGVLEPNRWGEIFVRGEQVSGEYMGRGVDLEEGWFRTKDGGWLDEGGYLFIDGRVDDVIVRGAENLSPGEIEDTLLGHAGVREVAVIGIPSEEWGEAVAAVVVPEPGAEPTEEELQQYVRERLRSSRAPERIEFREELPYNEMGKLLRRVLRDDFGQEA